MSSDSSVHLLDLPLELLDEIIKRMDLNSMDQVEKTCKFLRDRISNFKEVHHDIITKKLMAQRAYIDDNEEEEDPYYDDEACDSDDFDNDDFQGYMNDCLSMGESDSSAEPYSHLCDL